MGYRSRSCELNIVHGLPLSSNVFSNDGRRFPPPTSAHVPESPSCVGCVITERVTQENVDWTGRHLSSAPAGRLGSKQEISPQTKSIFTLAIQGACVAARPREAEPEPCSRHSPAEVIRLASGHRTSSRRSVDESPILRRLGFET
jgi:hypothetical protein